MRCGRNPRAFRALHAVATPVDTYARGGGNGPASAWASYYNLRLERVTDHTDSPWYTLRETEYLATAALYDSIFLIHIDGEQPIGLDNASETDHFWLQK